MKKRRIFTKDYKIAAIQLEREKESIKAAADELGIDQNLLSRWKRELSKKQNAAFQGQGNALLTKEQKEIIRLKKEIKELKLDRQILKEAMGIFSEKRHKSFNSLK